MFQRPWVIPTAAGLACLLLAIGFASLLVVAQALLILSALFFGASVYVTFANRRDPYDLKELWEPPADEPEEQEGEFDSVHCLHCGTVYSVSLPVCPRCGRR